MPSSVALLLFASSQRKKRASRTANRRANMSKFLFFYLFDEKKGKRVWRVPTRRPHLRMGGLLLCVGFFECHAPCECILVVQ